MLTVYFLLFPVFNHDFVIYTFIYFTGIAASNTATERRHKLGRTYNI